MILLRATGFFCWFLTILASSAVPELHARELHASALVEPEKTGLSLPLVRIQSSDLKLEKISEGKWSYSLTNEKRVLGLASVGLEGTPESYYSVPIMIRVPYDTEGPIKVKVYAVQVNHSNEKVIDLFAVDVVNGVDLDTLFELYPRASGMSSRRLASIQQTGRSLYVFDVQTFFKFLEIARELGKNANLAPSDDVRKIRTFLRTRLGVQRDKIVIGRAIPRGVAELELLLSQVDAIEAEQLKKVWQQIKSSDTPSSGSPESCARYSGFKDTLLNDFDPLLRQRWDADKNYMFTSLVTDVLTLCVTRTAEKAKAIAKDGELPVEVKRRISELYGPVDAKMVVVGKSSQLQRKVENHSKTLKKYGIPISLR